MMTGLGAAGVALTLAGCLVAQTVAAAEVAPCFEEIEQNYAWDDGGLHWKLMPDKCPQSQGATPAERKWGGSTRIQASGEDAVVIEETYAWVPHPHWVYPECTYFTRTFTRRTRIAKNGILYDTTQKDDDPPKVSQRALRPKEIISTGNIQTVPKPNDAFVEIVGNDTIAGQPCQVVTPKQLPEGAARFRICVFVAPIDCRRARYVQPLDMTITQPDGTVSVHGRTSLLRVGGKGTVAGEIVTP